MTFDLSPADSKFELDLGRYSENCFRRNSVLSHTVTTVSYSENPPKTKSLLTFLLEEKFAYARISELEQFSYSENEVRRKVRRKFKTPHKLFYSEGKDGSL